MKTLKKTLCLVLAMVMVFGLCAVSASAKLDSYTDKDDITYAEAVDVMTGIGVLSGDARGFRPGDTITRAEAAKIISYLLIGNAAQADALKTTSDPFSDVPASHWAAGYIAYCAQRGIIAGMGDGYHPSDNVTGLQFAKMLLCALGYGVNDEYTGTDWAINVSKDALTEGIALFKGNLGGANNDPATREECALYAFNALFVGKVSYSALLGGYITTNATAWGDAASANEGATIADDFLLDKGEDDEDAFGRPTGHYWYVEKTSNVISATYGNPKDEIADVEDLQAKYTDTVKYSDIFSLIGGKNYVDGLVGADDSETIEVYVDGDDSAMTINKADLTKNNTNDIPKTGKGVETYVYTWSEKDTKANKQITVNHLRIVIINTYLAKVTDVTPGTATKDPSTRVDILAGNGGAYTVASKIKKGFNTDEFEEKDYVLVTAAKVGTNEYAIQTMTAPVIKETPVSRYTNSKGEISITADGAVYEASVNDAKDDANDIKSTQTITKAVVDGDPRVLYIDNNGYLVAVGDVNVDSDYVYVAQFGYKTDTSNSLTDKNNLVADIYYADGTHKIVTVNNTDASVTVGNDTITNAVNVAVNNKSDADALNAIESDGTPSTSNKIGIYKLTMKSGKAVLSQAGTDISDNPATAYSVTKGISTIYDNQTAIASKSAGAKTVFYYVKNNVIQKDGAWVNNYDEDGYSVTAYTGIRNVPVAKDQEAVAIAYIPNATTATNIDAVLVKSNFGGDSSDNVYFYTGDNYYKDYTSSTWAVEYYVYENGVEIPIRYTYKDKDAADKAVEAAEGLAGCFFTVKDNEEHTFAQVTSKKNSNYYVSANSTSTKIVSVDGETIELTSAPSITGADPAATMLFAYGDMKIIDVTGDGDELDDLVINASNLKKYVKDGVIVTIGGTDYTTKYDLTVAIQCEANSSQPVLYMYIVDVDINSSTPARPVT